MIARHVSPAGLLLLVGLMLLTACAPRRIELPDPSVAARYPDFLFPAVPAGLGTPAALDRHRAAWLWLQAGDLRAAQRHFEASLKQAGAFYPAEAGLGYVFLARKDHDEAVEHFDRAIVANPRYVPALVGRGEALLALGDREMALKSFEAAVSTDESLAPLRSRIEVLRFRGLQEDVAEARKAAEAGRLPEARAAYTRALAASPASPFLHRELALVERRANDVDLALKHAARAAELEPSEPRHLVLLGELHEQQGDVSRALELYQSAHALEADPALEARIDALREKLLAASLPPEFQAIETADAITRAQLAALIGVRLGPLLKRAPGRGAAVITDARGSWASPWILAVTRAGVMEVYPNHTFQPSATVRRADLAAAVSRVLSLIAAEQPHLADSWRNARGRFPDLSPGHLSYPAASLAVEAGAMQTLPDGSFQLSRPVTGPEALASIRRLEELAQRASR